MSKIRLKDIKGYSEFKNDTAVSFFKCEDEYPGWTGKEKFVIVTDIPEEELLIKYADIMGALRPYLIMESKYGDECHNLKNIERRSNRFAENHQTSYLKTSQAVDSIAKKQKNKTSAIEVWLSGLSEWLSKHIKLNDFKRAQLEADLITAQINKTPEQYKSDAIVKAALIGVLAIPVAFFMPIICPVILILAIVLYNIEIKKVAKVIGIKRQKIEYELPRLVFTIEKTLKHSRDVLYMLDTYRENAGPELKHELSITVADMKSGNYEESITRLESRVGSPMMSDICRGLIGILRGDETELYWASLEIKFNDVQRQQLRMQAKKVPKKVKRLSMCLLVCFMLTYVVVILSQIVDSLGTLFA